MTQMHHIPKMQEEGNRNGKLHDSLPCCWIGPLPMSDPLGTDSGLAPPYSTPFHPVPSSLHGPSENRISKVIKRNLYSEVLLCYELNKSHTSVAMQTDTILQCLQMLFHPHLTSTTALRLSKIQQEIPSPLHLWFLAIIVVVSLMEYVKDNGKQQVNAWKSHFLSRGSRGCVNLCPLSCHRVQN